ncbi:hypothetical protein Tco_1547930, partial [Tanacetum coccineum]
NSRSYDHEVGPSRAKRSRNIETVEEALLPDVHHEFLEWRGCSREAKSRYNSRAFNIREPIYPELCREFYATYEFDESTLLEFAMRLGLYHVDELEILRRRRIAERSTVEKMNRKRRKKERKEERRRKKRRIKVFGFDTYFQGGLRSGENFNAREYWERISLYRDLHLSMSSITSVRFSILKVLHKMITYGLCQRTTRYEKIQRNDMWLLSVFEYRHQNGYANVAWVIVKWMKRKGAGSQKDSQICCGQFISKIARKSRVLTEEIIRSLSTPVYCRDLDRTTLRELIDSEDRLIPDIPVDDV